MFSGIIFLSSFSLQSQPNEQLALQHSLGLGVLRDYPRALVYASLGVLEDSCLSHHLLGHWYEAGIGVPKQCHKSLYHYDYLAKVNYQKYLEGYSQVGGQNLPKPSKRLDTSGLYNEGKPNVQIRSQDILLLYKVQADGGDVVSQYMLGQVYYAGDEVERDYKLALNYFRQAAKQYPSPGGNQDDAHAIKQAKIAASSACAYIGKMYIRGEGVEVDYGKGREWFERGAGQESPGCHTGLARVYLYGLGVEKDYEKGLRYLNEASVLGDGMAKILLALELEKSHAEYTQIVTLLDIARQKGVPEAYYHLGRILRKGFPNSPPNCKLALKYTKKWVELTGWHDDHLNLAQTAYDSGDYDDALINYLVAAETGLEVAQINAAILLDEDKVDFEKLNYNNSEGNLNRFNLALPLYLRAANQGNVDARVRAGGNLIVNSLDLYYYGFSTTSSPQPYSYWTIAMLPHSIAQTLTNLSTKPDFETALIHYSTAAEGDLPHSSMAMFNLGWMYEHGLGVNRDFYLAKRWYDLSLVTNPQAYLPVQIAGTYLHIKWVLTDFFGYVFGRDSYSGTGVEEIPKGDEGEELRDEGTDWEGVMIMGALGVLTVLVYLRRGMMAENPVR